MKYQYFIGIDISKKTLDIVLVDSLAKPLLKFQTSNDGQGVHQMLEKLKALSSFTLEQCLFCAEHTGMYTYHVAQIATLGGLLCLESGKQIKHSSGIQRGKNDQLDAYKIALYALRYQDKLRLWQPASHTITTLEQLYALRDRLIKSKQTLEVPLQEQKNFMATTHYTLMEKYALPAIQMIENQIAEVEIQIRQTIDQDSDFQTLVQLLDSIPGIGENIATQIIIKTQGFTRFTDPKKFACHAGIAPFSYSSGTSVRAKTKTSAHADKELKKLLHLAAMSIVRGKTLLAQYYKRKVAEKKDKMLVINNLRNKLVHIIFAVVKKHEFYQENYASTLA